MELVGTCTNCNKHIFCRDGFLEGVMNEKGQLLCYLCLKKLEKNDSV